MADAEGHGKPMPGQDRAQGMEPLGADFDERDEAVKFMLRRAIQACRTKGEYVASAGTGPAIFRIRIDSCGAAWSSRRPCFS